jgi:DNA mismatch endonuclease (patch repair protein)
MSYGTKRERGADYVRDPKVTSRIMSAVRNKDSKAEIALRSALHRMGLRFRKNVGGLPGKPDIVFSRQRIVVFVDGDFWHGNAWRLRGCASLAELFPTGTHWWVSKIERNMARDMEVTAAMEADGWRVVRVWESDVIADAARCARAIAEALSHNAGRAES